MTNEEDPAGEVFRNRTMDPISGNIIYSNIKLILWLVQLVRWKIHKSFSQLRAPVPPKFSKFHFSPRSWRRRGEEGRKEKGNKSDRICIALGISSTVVRRQMATRSSGLACKPFNRAIRHSLWLCKIGHLGIEKSQGGKNTSWEWKMNFYFHASFLCFIFFSFSYFYKSRCSSD